MAAKQRTGKPPWDKAPRKVNPKAKLKNLPEEDQEALWLLMHPTDETVTPYTLEAAMVHVLEEHDISVAVSTMGEWHSWYSLKLRMDAATERATQTAEELTKNTDMSPEDIERVAQTVFTAESLASGNLKGYVALAKLNLAKTKAQLDRDKLSAATKTKIEQGLDALLAEIQGNPKALVLFKQLQEVVSKA